MPSPGTSAGVWAFLKAHPASSCFPASPQYISIQEMVLLHKNVTAFKIVLPYTEKSWICLYCDCGTAGPKRFSGKVGPALMPQSQLRDHSRALPAAALLLWSWKLCISALLQHTVSIDLPIYPNNSLFPALLLHFSCG